MQPGRTHASQSRNSMHKAGVLCIAAALLLTAPLVWAERTQLKPGWNIFSTDQDIQIGHKVARQAENKLPMLADQRVDEYLNTLGRKLAGYAPGAKFPYEFHCVNSHQVNSFALPGGVVFIYRGIIEEAGDEAQLAGVMAHEISHAALRHGTNQATKAEMSTGVLGILGGVVGGGSVGAVVSEAGEDLATSSVLLKYSRNSETQADVLGTQILFDSGYDPRAMGQFFENIENEGKRGRFAEFFSDHPIPEHRIERIDKEIDKMGGPPKDYKSDSADFRELRRYIVELPTPPNPPEKGKHSAELARTQTDDRPSLHTVAPSAPPANLHDYAGTTFSAQYPADWQASGQDDSVSFLPPRGTFKDARDNPATGYGVSTGVFQPQAGILSNASDGEPFPETTPSPSLNEVADQLLATLTQSRPHLKPISLREGIQVDGQPAISVKLANDSPLGGPETDWLIAVLRPQSVLYFICAAPENEFADYDSAFRKIISSVRLK
jgi:beta-barrel assembly-enhancing protease